MKKLFIFNNLNKQKEELLISNSPQLNIYSCGPTVYDHSHIGHARASITWDFVVRFLRHIGYQVSWTRNITDIDDKIINRAKELNIHPNKLARIFTYSYHEDMMNLNVDWPDHEPRATEYIEDIIRFIDELVKKGVAYQIESDIYFSINSFKNYGKLKGQNISELEKGFGRIEPNPKKKHPLDFALWKSAKSKSEYSFESKWGRGRPGWHIECSAMNYAIYKDSLDIHCGGDDLIFPHHENEIAQSESLTTKEFAKYWLHNGMILVNGKKMSKSEGNFITIKDAFQKATSNALRLFMLNTHYRMPINYTEEAITASKNGVYRLQEALSDFSDSNNNKKTESNSSYLDEFNEALSDDFNSPKALAILFKITDNINTEQNLSNKQSLQKELISLSNILGFRLRRNAEEGKINTTTTGSLIEKLLSWRRECKQNKDFSNGDRIRNILVDSKVEIKDLPNNETKWQIKP